MAKLVARMVDIPEQAAQDSTSCRATLANDLQKFSSNASLLKALQLGVAWHNAGLPLDLRIEIQIVEADQH